MPAHRLLSCTVLSLSALAWLPTAAADEANPNFLPFGERAAFLGNAGITSDVGEAIYYNPANLARIGHPNLSVSGNLYVRFEFEADPFLVIAGEDQSFEGSGFMSIPSTLVSTYQIGGWYLGTAVLVPDAFTFKNRVAFEGPDLTVTLLQESQLQSLWVGTGVGRQLAPGLTAGLSVFITHDTESQFSFVRFDAMTDPPVTSEVTSNFDSSVWNALAIAGVFWQATPALGLGLRARLPPIKLTGSADVYQALLTASADADQTIEEEFEDVEVSRPLPFDVGMGVSFRATPRLELLADVNVQMPATLTRISDDRIDNDDKVKVELTPRVGGGVEWAVLSQLWLRLGFLYNPSAHPTPEDSGDEAAEDFAGVTGGLAWQKDRTQTALGGFFLYSSPDIIVEGSDPVRKSDAREVLYGALLTVSYRL
jgi:hypothetical protein